MSSNRNGVCAKTRKHRYRTELDAKIGLASTQRKQASKREECRVYRCSSCRGWHLTSQPKRSA